MLDDPLNVELLRRRLEAMRAAAALWATAKKVTPKILSELSPLVRDTPEAAFFSVPPGKDQTRTKAQRSKARQAGARRRPKR